MKRRKNHVHHNAVQSKTVKVYVTRDDIESAECGLPTKCMIKVALKRALNLAHGYISVDATGVSISRNGSYREKAFLPRAARINMVRFDQDKSSVKPHSFTLSFFKTSKVRKYSEEEVAAKTTHNIRTGNAKKKYGMRHRVVGIAVAGGNLAA